MSLRDDMEYAAELARGAGRIILDHFGRVRRLTKTHAAAQNEVVTEVDRASQRFIAAGLRSRFPRDGFLGEENETGDAITFDAARSGTRVWVIDPIDGTSNFVAGVPIFGVCIGLLDAGRPVAGVIHDVCRGTTFSAAQGHGAYFDGRRLHAATTPMNDGSILMMTSSCYDDAGHVPAFAQRWLAQTNWKLRILGSAALEAAYVAAGVAHGALTMHGKLWDIAAAAAILAESGAVVTDLAGAPIFPFNLTGYVGAKVPFLAGGPAAHAELLADIRRG
jgi:myo-inositol-1(or 4)-monophosphatase